MQYVVIQSNGMARSRSSESTQKFLKMNSKITADCVIIYTNPTNNATKVPHTSDTESRNKLCATHTNYSLFRWPFEVTIRRSDFSEIILQFADLPSLRFVQASCWKSQNRRVTFLVESKWKWAELEEQEELKEPEEMAELA